MWMPRSSISRLSTRWTMVAPTCDLMSSPMIGTPAFSKRSAHSGRPAMNTGRQFTKATPALRACSA